MAIYRFTGRILPPHYKINLTNLPTVHWSNDSGHINDCDVKIVESNVEIVCDSNKYLTDNDYAQVHLQAVDSVRSALDTFGFITGIGLTVFLDKVIKPDGIEYNIVHDGPHLAAFVQGFDLSPSSFTGLYQIIVSDPAIILAMNDLVVCLSLHHHAFVNCGRVVEAIRELISPGITKKQAWPLMRQNLNIEEGYLAFITDQSSGPRHADRKGIKREDYQEIIDRTWIIMNRFLEFRKRGNQQLPIADFPLLS